MTTLTKTKIDYAQIKVPWLREHLLALAVGEMKAQMWHLLEVRGDGASWERRPGAATVIVSGAVELDGRRWLHVSLAHPRWTPSYSDLCRVKELFIGADREAYQKFARQSEHVNLHPNCLHLWSCFDGDPLPDFTRGGDSI
jgi:hypothetical protein